MRARTCAYADSVLDGSADEGRRLLVCSRRRRPATSDSGTPESAPTESDTWFAKTPKYTPHTMATTAAAASSTTAVMQQVLRRGVQA
jgi:hypothetical protein